MSADSQQARSLLGRPVCLADLPDSIRAVFLSACNRLNSVTEALVFAGRQRALTQAQLDDVLLMAALRWLATIAVSCESPDKRGDMKAWLHHALDAVMDDVEFTRRAAATGARLRDGGRA